MSEGNESNEVRRFGRKDRKRSLERRHSLFLPDDEQVQIIPEDVDTPATAVVEEVEEIAGEQLPLGEDAAPVHLTKAPVAPKSQSVHSGKRGRFLPNLLALLFLLATLGAVGVFATITANPYSPLNPFPPFTPIPVVITATFLPPTFTPQPTSAPTATFTPLPPDTFTNNPSSFVFQLATGDAIYAPNANEKGCNWSSIAGTVTDRSGTPLNGYRIHVIGNDLDEAVFSGTALTFGQGGFELFLNGTPQANTYQIQLEDPTGVAASQIYSVSTQGGCDQNVAILNFVGQ
ncbi:MAG: hypothetical protein R3E39_14765 [Anaerolineae bacterium]